MVTISVDKPAAVVTYFVQSGSNGPIKIGITRGNPYKRLVAIQVGNHEVLKVLGWVEGDVEESLHDLFAMDRVRGEWFNCTSRLVEFIETTAVYTPPIDLMTGWFPVHRAMHMFGERRGISRSKVESWCIRGCDGLNGETVVLQTRLIANELATTEEYVRLFKSLALIHTCRLGNRQDRINCSACKQKSRPSLSGL